MLPVSPSTFRLPYTFLLPPESGASDIDDRVTSPRLSRSSQSCKTQAMSLSPRQGLNIVILGGDSLNRSLSIAHRLPSTACPEPCRRVHRHSSQSFLRRSSGTTTLISVLRQNHRLPSKDATWASSINNQQSTI